MHVPTALISMRPLQGSAAIVMFLLRKNTISPAVSRYHRPWIWYLLTWGQPRPSARSRSTGQGVVPSDRCCYYRQFRNYLGGGHGTPTGRPRRFRTHDPGYSHGRLRSQLGIRCRVRHCKRG